MQALPSGLSVKEQRRDGLWEVIEKKCLHPHFNQSLARKEKYGEQGIESEDAPSG